MRIDKLEVKNKPATVILGAGASRGASCFKNSLIPAPLDTDFFALMQRVQHSDKLLAAFVEFLRTEFGPGACPRMEEFFTQLEALDEFHKELKIQPGPKVRRYGDQLRGFVEITAAFFRLIFAPDNGPRLRCENHEALAKALNSGDTVISFNYDCLMDGALAINGERSWDVTTGYGLDVEGNVESWKSVVGPGPRAKNSIKLLKLHGSLNWDRTDGNDEPKIKLRPDPYIPDNRHASEIVPPVWDKTIGGDTVYRELWKHARQILPTGRILVVVGYSVPPTDLLSQALIRVAASERAATRKLSHLIVVNPDAASRGRFVDLVKSGLSSSTIIVELSKFDELKMLLEERPTSPSSKSANHDHAG